MFSLCSLNTHTPTPSPRHKHTHAHTRSHTPTHAHTRPRPAQLGADGESRLSGAVYMAAHSPHRRLLDSTVAAFSLTNPLHADSFPSVRQMEAEVVAMTAGLLGGGPAGPAPQVGGCGDGGGVRGGCRFQPKLNRTQCNRAGG